MNPPECFSRILGMDAKTCRRRLLNAFHGVLQVVAVRGGAAETCDRRQWKRCGADEAIVSLARLSEIQYGAWTANGGEARARVRGTCCSSLIEETGEPLITALESDATRVPLRAPDVGELWLLDAGGGIPLALPETAVDAARERPLATSKAFRLYPRMLDREGLRPARVKAQRMGGARRPERLAEPFYPLYIE